MASVILLRPVPVEHVTLAGDCVHSRRAAPRHFPESIRADVREQTRAVRLPDSVNLFWRLMAATEVLP